MSEASPMTQAELKALVDATNGHLRNKSKNTIVGDAPGKPRFELYHADPSLCSHKVRSVMAEKGVTYFSHAMNIMPAGNFVPQNYRPEYVRLRLKGSPGGGFVSGYTGASSVEREGFDPCVVPTLVDHEAAKVIVDSRAICEYVNREAGTGEDLVPAGLESVIDEQIRLVDDAPHVASLYGAHPDEDRRPMGLRKNIAGIHAKKIRVLTAMMEQSADDPELLAAYRAKVSKEAAAGAFMIDDDGMRETHRKMAAHVDALESQLQSHSGAWVCGDQYTMADIMWTTSLWRMKWLGFGRLWEGKAERARLTEYLERAFVRPSVRSAVVNWPGAHAPSPHVKEHSGPGFALNFFWHMARGTDWQEVFFGDPKIKLPPLEPLPTAVTSTASH
ncbi:MAG: glutathione S-transferase family protein [Pseudomonadota bacterium]